MLTSVFLAQAGLVPLLATTIDPMMKMWFSFIGIGLMVLAAFVVTYARKKKGWVRLVITIIAVVALIYGAGFSIVSIF